MVEKQLKLKGMNALVGEQDNPRKKYKDKPQDKKAQALVRKGLENAYLVFEKKGYSELTKHFSKNIQPAGNYDFAYINTKILWDTKL